ncbi:MAG: biotin--protein ligase [Desulfohalobiaceae bacterium]|nr:biotin--protein ligase [Desulfohalobiaceae bacterium]
MPLERSHAPPGSPALLWDESHFWGILLLRALEKWEVPFHLIRSRDIASGALRRLCPPALLVPGGWASRKAKGLGGQGRREIQEYVYRGGQYLGFCGGAGLALRTDSPQEGLGICPWGRKPLQERLPNCSGHVSLRTECGSPFCPDSPDQLRAPVWWPAQFQPHPLEGPKVLATYADPGEDFWVADTPASGLDRACLQALERTYGINLDPEWLRREPAMIQGEYGEGEYLLTYLHLETPASPQANRWLARILRIACPKARIPNRDAVQLEWDLAESPCAFQDEALVRGRRILWELVRTGQEHFLLTWRKPWLLGWKRGVPGFALNTLLALVCRAAEAEPTEPSLRYWAAKREDFLARLEKFGAAYEALLRKMHLLQTGSEEIKDLRDGMERDKQHLVGPFPGQEGIFAGLAADLQELIAIQAVS